MKPTGLLLIAFSVGVASAQTTSPSPMFAPATLYSTPAGAYPRAFAVGDFNGDQISDVAIINPYSQTLTILLGTLTGSLVSPSPGAKTPLALVPLFQVNLGYTPTAIAAGYFQSSAPTTLDLAIAGPSSITIWSGDGTGNFKQTGNLLGFLPPTPLTPSLPPLPSPATPLITAMIATDFDGDGFVDLAVTDSANNAVWIYFGDGTGNFFPRGISEPVYVGNHPVALAAGNFDGFPGLAVANQRDGTITVISLVPSFSVAGLPNSSYTAITYPAVPVLPGLFNPPFPYPTSLAVADVNGDGIPDVIAANDGTNNLSILLGNGRGGFTYAPGSPVAVGAAPVSVTTADFNGDGNQDVAVANYASGNVSVLLGNGSGAFSPATGSPFASGESTVFVAVGDFNGASRASLAALNEIDNTLTVLLNAATPPVTVVSGGSFTAPVSPGSLIAILGAGLATSSAASSTAPASYFLGGASVAITYSNNAQDQLLLTAASPTQLTALIPPNPTPPATLVPGAVNPVPGLATVTVVTPSKTQTALVEIAPFAPSLLSAYNNGKGLANGTFSGGAIPAPISVFEPACQLANNCPAAGPPACSATNPCYAQTLNFSQGGTLTLQATGLNTLLSVLLTVGGETVQATVTPPTAATTTTTPAAYTITANFGKAPPQRGLVPVFLTVLNPSGSLLNPNNALVSNVVYVLIQ